MKAFLQAMAQSGASRCLLHTLLSIPLLLNSWVSAGFISPGNSVSIGTSPTLRYLLTCGHLPTKPPIFSTHDIYTNEQVLRAVFVSVSASIYAYKYLYLFLPPKLIKIHSQVAKGVRHLQAALGLAETGLEGEEERGLVKRGKCVLNKSLNKEPFMSPETGITFPESSLEEIFNKTEDNSVNFEGVATRNPKVILPGRLGNDQASCQHGRLVRRCGKKTNQACSWFCRNKKRTRQWN